LDKTDARVLAPLLQDDSIRAFVTVSAAVFQSQGLERERVVVAGFVLLAFLAGLIIFIASFFDSLT
jgi:hypothetical protein